MKKTRRLILITLLIMIVLTGGIFFLLMRGGAGESKELSEKIAEDQSDQGESKAYRFDIDKGAIVLAASGEDKNVLNFENKNVYKVSSSTASRERLDRLIRRLDTDFEHPIIAMNPFGTCDHSFYFYFKTGYAGMIRYTVTVEDPSIPDYVRYWNNGQEGNLTKEHEFVVSGLVQGMTNYIILEVLDSNGNKREFCTYRYDVPDEGAKVKLGKEDGRSKEKSENGLFFVLPEGNKSIYTYDNSGILRSVLNTETAHGRRVYQAGDGLLYQVSDTKVVKVSGLGRVLETAEVKGYGAIRDYSYDGYGNIFSLVKKKRKHYLVCTSLETGKTRKIYEFPKKAVPYSITNPKAGTLYAACSSPAGVIRFTDVMSRIPKIDYILGKKKTWKTVFSKKKALKKVKEDKQVCKWNTSSALLNLLDERSDGTNDEISAYVLQNGKGTGVWFRVDDRTKKTEIEKAMPFGGNADSSFQIYGNHYIVTDRQKGSYEEYDEEGKVTRRFSYGKAVSNVVKLSLQDLCFFALEK